METMETKPKKSRASRTEMVGVRLPEEVAQRLTYLSEKTKLTKTLIVHRALIRAMDAADAQLNAGANPQLINW